MTKIETTIFGLEIDFAKPRTLVIKVNNRIYHKCEFDGMVFSDSEILHEILCRIDPGMSCSATFRNSK